MAGASLYEALLTPTRIYAKTVSAVLSQGAQVSAIAHITGGGITENLDRVLPQGCDAEVQVGTWEVPRIIDIVSEAAGLTLDEALKTFNMGIGLVFVCPPDHGAALRVALESQGEHVYEIGRIVDGSGKVTYR